MSKEWIGYADLLGMPLPKRIQYVRSTLGMTQPEFSEAVGRGAGHHAVLRWEKGTQPQPQAREAIAALTPYPAEAFSLAAGAEASLASVDARLRDLRADVADLTALVREAIALLHEAGGQADGAAQSHG